MSAPEPQSRAARLRQQIEEARERIADDVVDRQYELQPEVYVRFGKAGRVRCLEDVHYHLSYLGEAVALGLPSLFGDYVAWGKVVLAGRGIGADDLALNLRLLQSAIEEHLGADVASLAAQYIGAGLEQLPTLPVELPSYIVDEEELATAARRYLDALLAADRREAARIVRELVDSGVDVRDIYLGIFQPAQLEVGRLWQMNKLSVAQEHYCTAATQLIMSQLYVTLFSTDRIGHTLVATSVSGDLHEIGVRMISDFLEAEGWDTFYLGANAPTPSVIKAIIDRRADLVAISATMTYHVRAVSEMIASIRATPACANVAIIVGGYPFNVEPELWRRIGADGCARDARQAVELATRLVTSRSGNG